MHLKERSGCMLFNKKRISLISMVDLDKKCTNKLVRKIKDIELLNYALVLASSIENEVRLDLFNEERLNLFIKVACCKELLKSTKYKQVLTIICSINNISLMKRTVNVLCSKKIINSAYISIILNLIENSKECLEYILDVVENLVFDSELEIEPIIFRKIILTDKSIISRLINILKIDNIDKKTIEDIIYLIFSKNNITNIINYNLNEIIRHLEIAKSTYDVEHINLVIFMIDQQVSYSKPNEKCEISIPTDIEAIACAKRLKFLLETKVS